MVAGTVAAARGRPALPLLVPKATAVATEVRLGSVRLHPEVTHAHQVDGAGHGPLNKAQQLRAGHTAHNAPLEPHETLWDGHKVNIHPSWHTVNDNHLLPGVEVSWHHHNALKPFTHQHGIRICLRVDSHIGLAPAFPHDWL